MTPWNFLILSLWREGWFSVCNCSVCVCMCMYLCKSRLCVCVYFYMSKCMLVNACVHSYGGQPQMLFLRHSLSTFSSDRASLAYSSPSRLCWLASESQRATHFCLPMIMHMYHHAWLLYMRSGAGCRSDACETSTLVTELPPQPLYPLLSSEERLLFLKLFLYLIFQTNTGNHLVRK